MVAVNATYPNLLAASVSFEQWVRQLSCALAPEEKARLQVAWNRARAGCTDHPHASERPCFARAQAVAALLAELGLDTDTIAAGLLHQLPRLDCFEPAALAAEMNGDVASLVDGIAKVSAIGGLHSPFDEKSGNQMEASRKMTLALARDVRVVFIALAIRLIDMRDSDGKPEPARLLMARQTLTLYAPLANRLGLARLKWELQDLSLRILEPAQYREIARLLATRRVDRERDIDNLKTQISEALARAGIHAAVNGRPKHIYSIWQKMQQKDLTFDGLFDIRAFRILVDNVSECYGALAVIHELWSPIPEEYSDYIAAPKANDYRSLHTVVRGPGNTPIEVQFRTHQMHEQAELGGAAHWRYKEGGRQDDSFDAKVAWLRELLQWAQTEADKHNAIGRYKTELFEDRVYVLSPQGDVVDLPRGATPVEFAYRIHTQVGHHCRGAKVNGKMVGLTHKLQTGDRVAILTARNAEPSRDWLHPESGYLVSARARAKVQRWFRSRDYDRHVADGRLMLERELRRLSAPRSVKLERLAQHSRFPKLDDFLAAIGRGDITSGQIARLLDTSYPVEKPALQPAAPQSHGEDSRDPDTIIVDGVNNLYTRLAGCCCPVTGDAIVGFITRNYGISIHCRDCANIARLDESARQRLIPAQWGDAG